MDSFQFLSETTALKGAVHVLLHVTCRAADACHPSDLTELDGSLLSG